MWVPVPPSHEAALAGATVLLNLSASPITVGRAEDRHLLARSASSRCNAAYLYAAASAGESSTDLSWDGMTMVYEMGDLLGESERFPDGPRRTVVDVDLDRLRQERMRQGSFEDNADAYAADEGGFRVVPFELAGPADRRPRAAASRRPLPVRARRRRPPRPRLLRGLQHPGVRARAADARHRWRRLGPDADDRHRRLRRPRLHHALIVAGQGVRPAGPAAHARPRLHDAGLRTSAGTKCNAIHLMESLGITGRSSTSARPRRRCSATSATRSARGEEVYDVTFENVQAGLRTDYLFRGANQRGGIVLGTGDLSELALGWCTYGVGDQMSHYGVNTGVPKTLMQHLIRWVVS